MNIKKYIKFLIYEPTFDIKLKNYIDIKKSPYFMLLSGEITKNNISPIFLIGPWGSGKTVTLNSLKESKNNSFIFTERNYFGVRSVDEALSHLIGLKWRLILFIELFFLVCIFYYLTNSYLLLGQDIEKYYLNAITLKGMVGTAIIFLFGFVIKPQSRLLFFSSFLNQLLFYKLRSSFSKKKTIVIIEDLDRSALTASEKFSFLAQLPPLPVRYIISYGHNNESEYIQLVECINKLSGIAIELKQDQKIVFEILKNYISYLPFNESAKWMSEIPLRDIISCYYSCDRNFHDRTEFEKKFELVLIIFNYIKNKKIKPPQGRDSSDLQISFNGGKFKLDNSSLSFTRLESEILNSFFSNIEANYFAKCLNDSVDENEKNASNWIDVAWQNACINLDYRSKLASKLK